MCGCGDNAQKRIEEARAEAERRERELRESRQDQTAQWSQQNALANATSST